MLSVSGSFLCHRTILAIFTGWLFYVELVLVVGCGIVWVVQLTRCLALFNPLLILP